MKLQKIILIMISLILILGNIVYAENTVSDETIQEPESSVEEEPREDTTPDDIQEPTQPDESKQVPWPDLSGVQGKIERTGSQVKIVLSNIKTSSLKIDYYYALTKDSNVTLNDVNKLAVKGNDGTITIMNNDLKEIYATNCNMFLTLKLVTYYNNEKQEMLTEPIKLERTEQYGIGDRVKLLISENYIQGSINECIGANRKVNIKIGEVTDKELLNSIRNGTNDWKQKLLQYSKNAKELYSNTVTTTELATVSVQIDGTQLNLIDNAYYYIYIDIDNENGKYITVEDVHFLQAKVDKDGIHKYLTTGFSFSNGNETPTPTPTDMPQDNTGKNNSKDPTVAPGILPKTGEGIAVAVAIVAVIALGIFAKTKYTKYKGI